MYSSLWPPVVMLCLIAFPALGQSAIPYTPLLGLWSYTDEGCTDTYLFRKDGTFTSTSGAERLDGRFAIEILPDHVNAPYKVSRTNLRDNLGKDCLGSSKNDVGSKDTRYVMFNASKDKMMVCSSPEGTKCFGPLLLKH